MPLVDDTIALVGFEGLPTTLSGYKIQEKSLLDGANPLKTKIAFEGLKFEVDVHMGLSCDDVAAEEQRVQAAANLLEAEKNAKIVEEKAAAVSAILAKVVTKRKEAETAQAAASTADTQNKDTKKYQEASKTRDAYAAAVSEAEKAQDPELEPVAKTAKDAIDALSSSLGSDAGYQAIKKRSDDAKAALDADLLTIASEITKAKAALATADGLLPALKFCFAVTHIDVTKDFDLFVPLDNTAELYGDVCLQAGEEAQECLFQRTRGSTLDLDKAKHAIEPQLRKTIQFANGGDLLALSADLRDEDGVSKALDDKIALVGFEGLPGTLSGYKIQEKSLLDGANPLKTKIAFEGLKFEVDVHMGLSCDDVAAEEQRVQAAANLLEAEKNAKIVEEKAAAVSAILAKVVTKRKEAETAQAAASTADTQNQDTKKYQEASKTRDAYAAAVSEAEKAQDPELEPVAKTAKDAIDALSTSLGSDAGYQAIKKRSDDAKAALDADLLTIASEITKAKAALATADGLLPALKFCFAVTHIDVTKRFDLWPDDTAELYGDVCLQAGEEAQQCLFQRTAGAGNTLDLDQAKHAIEPQLRKTIQFANGGDLLALSADLKDEDVALDDTIALVGFEGLPATLSGYKIQEKSLLDGANPIKAKIAFEGLKFEVDVHMGIDCASIAAAEAKANVETAATAAEQAAEDAETALTALRGYAAQVTQDIDYRTSLASAAAEQQKVYAAAQEARDQYAIAVREAAEARRQAGADSTVTQAADRAKARALAAKNKADTAQSSARTAMAAAQDEANSRLKFCLSLVSVEVQGHFEDNIWPIPDSEQSVDIYGKLCFKTSEATTQYCVFDRTRGRALRKDSGDTYSMDTKVDLITKSGLARISYVRKNLNDADLTNDDELRAPVLSAILPIGLAGVLKKAGGTSKRYVYNHEDADGTVAFVVRISPGLCQ